MGEMAALEPAWDEFARTTEGQTPVTNSLWVREWFKHVGADVAPIIISAWDNGQLAGIAPLAVTRRFPGTRVLTTAGAPHAALFDFAAVSGREREVSESIVSEIALNGNRWDLCDIADLDPLSPLPLAISDRTDDFVFAPKTIPEEPFFSLDLRSGEAGRKPSRKHRYNLKRARKRLGDFANVEFKIVSDADALSAYMPQVFEIHRRRWNGYYTGSLMNDPGGRAFLREIAKLYLERDRLYLALLTLNEKAIAYALCFHFGDTLYYYNPAFDPEYANFSPGSLLLQDILEDCRGRGISKIELGKGRLQYKERLAASSTTGERIIFAKRSSGASLTLRSYLAWLSMRQAARRSELVRKVVGRVRRPRVRA